MASRSVFENIVEDWAQRGLIGREQVPVLLDDLSRQQTNVSNRALVIFLAVISTMFLAIAVLVFVTRNWDGIPQSVKTVIALLLPLSTTLGSIVTLKALPLLSRSLRFFTILLVGASLTIILTLLQLDSDPAAFLLVWGGLGCVVAFVLMTEVGLTVAFALLASGIIWVVPMSQFPAFQYLLSGLVASWLGYALSFGFVAGVKKWWHKFPGASDRLIPNGESMRGFALVCGWCALVLGYPVFRIDSMGLTTFYPIYLLVYFGWLATMIVVGNQRVWPLMRNGSVLMVLVMVLILYWDIFSDYSDSALFYLAGGVLMLSASVAAERAVRAFGKRLDRHNDTDDSDDADDASPASPA